MWFTASGDDGWAADQIDRARRGLADIADALTTARLEAAGLAAQARWDSDAAHAFRSDADALAVDIAALTADVEQMRDDLLMTRAHAVQRALGGCG